MKRFFVMTSALAFLGFAAPAFAQNTDSPPLVRATDNSLDGRVEQLTNNHGDVDGVLLSTGVTVRFPKSAGDDVANVATIGSNIRVVGVVSGARRHEVIDAKKITNLDTGDTLKLAQ
jgi:hypothetical protein